jgi:hypothetical protein
MLDTHRSETKDDIQFWDCFNNTIDTEDEYKNKEYLWVHRNKNRFTILTGTPINEEDITVF